MFELRPYQSTAVDASVDYLTDKKKKGRNGLVVAPTGSGKSLIIASIAERLPGPCLVFQPSREILVQNLLKYESYGWRAAVFSASMNRRERGRVTFSTIGTAVGAAEFFDDVPFVLIDEAHLTNPRGGQYRDFLESMKQKRVLGLTATPFRLASNSFGSELRFLTRTRPRIFNDVISVTQLPDLFAAGYLCPIVYEQIDVLPKERLRLNSKGSEYDEASVQKLFGETGFVARLVDEVRRLLSEGVPSVLIFTASINEAERLAAAIPGAAVVTSDTPDRERARILDAFRRGQIPALANVGIFVLGVDIPELTTVVLGRPTMSLGIYYQQVGRVIRPHPSKKFARVVDLVGLVKQFGRIEDLVLRPGGEKGDLWSVCSGDRPLTNTLFAERDEIDPVVAKKASKRRSFWSKGRGRFRRKKKASPEPELF